MGIKKNKLVRASAFRAVKNTPQLNIPANTNTQVSFQEVDFDLAGEYNPNTNTFIPSKDGVYSITASVSFVPSSTQVNYSVVLGIRVNNVTNIISDNDFFGPSPFTNLVTVTGILRLNAGDVVDVTVNPSIPGSINPNNPVTVNPTHFEAARFPSPTM